ncbi:MAG: RsmB/NOP family class I SAM-dependent RNA methyltransferase [Gammaproteobacteria bacterium]|nr:RsmB/NOP family class I SAM-dependent RNA methyltransferase [Gammaproteobacteria bacterium]
MLPAAKLEAAIYLLEKISTERRPADDIVRGWIKARRFVGGTDRRQLRERVYGILRRRMHLDWHIENAGFKPTTRMEVIADVVLVDKNNPAELFDGSKHAPKPLNDDEQKLAIKLVSAKLEDPAMPAHVLVEMPEWMTEQLKPFYGERFMEEMQALNKPAPMDMRVNLARVTREQAQKSMAKDGIKVGFTKLSPAGITLEAHSDISRTKAFRTGLIEVQDAGSQILSFLTGAKPGMAVCDYCAGAGGKTLALADRLGLQGGAKENKSRLVACDTEESRLKRMDRRLDRAKLDALVDRHVIGDDNKWHDENSGAFDRVLVDAPCSGTGTWRRHPEQKNRITAERVAELTAIQDGILERAANLVKPGGRLVYATCSLLPEENEARVEKFIQAHNEYTVIPWQDAWKQAMPKTAPPKQTISQTTSSDYLRLSPAAHGSDGFFVAVLELKS